MTSETKDFKKMILKQVATKINNATTGKIKRKILPANVIDLARERAKRRLKVGQNTQKFI